MVNLSEAAWFTRRCFFILNSRVSFWYSWRGWSCCSKYQTQRGLTWKKPKDFSVSRCSCRSRKVGETEVCQSSRAASTRTAPQISWEEFLLAPDLNAETAWLSEQENLDYSLDLFPFIWICRKIISSVLLLWELLRRYIWLTQVTLYPRGNSSGKPKGTLQGQHLVLCFVMHPVWEAGMFASFPRISACFTQWGILNCASFSAMALKILILWYAEAGL